MNNNTAYVFSKTKEIELLAETAKNKVYIVKDNVTGELLVKKQLPIETNVDVYKKLVGKNVKGLPKVHYVVSDEDNNYIFEDYIPGVNLMKLLSEKKSFSPTQVMEWSLMLCDILEVLHENDPPIIHRDIKPSNVLISNDGILKLIDFDIAREYKEDAGADTAYIGTKNYASPEQYGFSQTDCRSDIFSLGIMMAELLTGETPRENLNTHGALGKVINKCIEIDPKQRFQNVGELRKALKQINQPFHKKSSIIAGGIAACMLIVIMLFILTNRIDREQDYNATTAIGQNIDQDTPPGLSDENWEDNDLADAHEGDDDFPDIYDVRFLRVSFYDFVLKNPIAGNALREALGNDYDFFMQNMALAHIDNNAVISPVGFIANQVHVVGVRAFQNNPSVDAFQIFLMDDYNFYVLLNRDGRQYYFTNDANSAYRIPYELGDVFPFQYELVFMNTSGNTNLQQGENVFYKGLNTITIILDDELFFELVAEAHWSDLVAVFNGTTTLRVGSNNGNYANFRHREHEGYGRIDAHLNFIGNYLYFHAWTPSFNNAYFEALTGIYRLR